MNFKVWKKEEIKLLLETNDEMVARSVKTLYEFQTTEEQIEKTTSANNGVGFNGHDAEFMSNIAEWLLSGRTLTHKQLNIARKKIIKYSNQLASIANARQRYA